MPEFGQAGLCDLATQIRIRKALPMSLGELFASIRERRRRAAQQAYEEGTQITRRVQELLAVPTPTQEVETPFTKARNENDSTCVKGFSQLE